MFHFPTFPPAALCVQTEVPGLYSRWVSPFGHPRITGRLSPSRGFSQTPTSFIGSRCQGIHHVHLVACCYYKDARVHCEVLKIRSVPHKDPAPARYPLRVNLVVRGGMWSEVSTLRADPSGPNSVPELMTTFQRGSTLRREVLTLLAVIKPNNRRSTSELSCVQTFAVQTTQWTTRFAPARQMLLRKEVIQPHLPVRLPCYDFVPIASPTFDGSLHKGWATGFGCCRLS